MVWFLSGKGFDRNRYDLVVTRIDIPTLAERKADIEVKGDAGAVELAVKAGEGYVADPADPKVDGTVHS